MQSNKTYLLFGLVLTALLAFLAFQFLQGGAYEFEGSLIETPLPASDFTLVDQDGAPFQLSAQRGKLVVIFFGYTHCPDVCPTTLAEMRNIRRDLGDRADEVAFLFITVDPERDTPELLKAHLTLFDENLVGLTGKPAVLAQVYQAYGVFVEKQEPTNNALGYEVDHTGRLFVIDRQGLFRLTFPFGFERQRIVQDLTYLLDEGN